MNDKLLRYFLSTNEAWSPENEEGINPKFTLISDDVKFVSVQIGRTISRSVNIIPKKIIKSIQIATMYKFKKDTAYPNCCRDQLESCIGVIQALSSVLEKVYTTMSSLYADTWFGDLYLGNVKPHIRVVVYARSSIFHEAFKVAALPYEYVTFEHSEGKDTKLFDVTVCFNLDPLFIKDNILPSSNEQKVREFLNERVYWRKETEKELEVTSDEYLDAWYDFTMLLAGEGDNNDS